MIKLFRLAMFLVFFCTVQILVAQEKYIIQDSRIQNLVDVHKALNSQDSSIWGYRVQIFFESGNFSKDLALKTANEFQMKYPDVPYYMSFKEPYYRIRVGEFRTIIEAKGFLQQILSNYPSAFEVKDKIYYPLLVN